ncbi:hypothetical protein K9M79_05070 [Candidatus Woesearchaeota archaeon]|nr:hypothetical protein [Candidatus Woesearchaeota archaeon]
MLRVSPLPASLMFFSMVGFIIVSIYGFWPDDTDLSGMTTQEIDAHVKTQEFRRDITIASDLVLVIMFISSVISTTYAPIEDEIEMEKRSKLDPLIK